VSLEPLDVPAILKQNGLRPDKKLGQNFLVDQISLQRVVDTAQIEAGDVILEIGPGLGSLTRLLARQARRVVAVELDSRLIPILQEILAPAGNIEILHGDIMLLNPSQLMVKPGYLVVANIPYYITSALIRHLLESNIQPKRLVLTVQLEVAERICAQPGRMSLLALSVQVYGNPQVKSRISSQAFYPAPKVDSGIVCVEVYPQPVVTPEQLDGFFRLVKAGFSQKRKNLRNSLSGGMGWDKSETVSILQSAGIDPGRRAETLSLAEWISLYQCNGSKN
jgi:16S rRNA (adenine1518-N6/adenine1519-N6)-dimethyltransferase